jgi:hypothetical protein
VSKGFLLINPNSFGIIERRIQRGFRIHYYMKLLFDNRTGAVYDGKKKKVEKELHLSAGD